MKSVTGKFLIYNFNILFLSKEHARAWFDIYLSLYKLNIFFYFLIKAKIVLNSVCFISPVVFLTVFIASFVVHHLCPVY